MKEGIVLRAANGVYTVQSENHIFHCSLRGNLKKTFQYSTSGSFARRVLRARQNPVNDTISVGDRVRFIESHHSAGSIEEILPRTSRFTRIGFRGREQTVVCNLDQLAITFSWAEPNLDPWKLDRFLVAAEAEGLIPLIVGNKADLKDKNPDALHHFAEWGKIGYRFISVSVMDGEGIAELAQCMADHISAFVGPSGVGKSSMLNVLIPGLSLKTSEIGYITGKGRHTTTSAQLIPLINGGWVVDTPGLRQLDLLKLSIDELFECFPEFSSFKGQCRFSNCSHIIEPDCALRTAAEAGVISARRYESYRLLAKEMEEPRR